ncbi:unnamed protein product [Brachionus calyciflorus]|uniref:Uncharacterized protein n=1 Tax=Brachionus calyciflorus TaxID=104777 RepID=A0A813LXM2_9BILA|nr:unnamed protein product [Brachionus calyciflorus]
MLNNKISVLLFVGFMVVVTNGLPVEQKKEKLKKTETEDLSTENEINVELLKAIRKGIMAEAILRERLSNDLGLDDDNDEFVDEERPKEKRFPKWRSGETRSKVKLLHQNNQAAENNDYSPVLRKIWENNMLEKNKLYQNLLG